MSSRKSFTLIELIVVIGIVGILIPITGLAYRNIRRQAHAAKILGDFRKIEAAWKLWKVDNGSYQEEDDYDTDNRECDIAVNDEPLLYSELDTRTTGLYAARGAPNWRGPYISGVLRDPFGEQYGYDYEPTDTGPFGGVNIILTYCGNNSRYEGIPEIIDRNIDNSDGPNVGRVRWVSTGTNAMIGYHLADTAND